MFQRLLRMQMLSPTRIGGMITHLPKFVRVFYRLMKDERVSIFAKAAPFLILFMMFTPPAIELDFVPVLGEIGLDARRLTSRSSFSCGYVLPRWCGSTSAQIAHGQ